MRRAINIEYCDPKSMIATASGALGAGVSA
jgi:hypothetical protein